MRRVGFQLEPVEKPALLADARAAHDGRAALQSLSNGSMGVTEIEEEAEPADSELVWCEKDVDVS